MGIRETLNRKPAIALGVALLAIVGTAYSVFYSVSSGNGPTPSGRYAYYTVDDGKSYFRDDASKVPPFVTAQGQEAVQAIVFSCNDGKEPFVGYLLRYTPDAAKRLTQLRLQRQADGNAKASLDPAISEILDSGLEMKRPGDLVWAKSSDGPRFQQAAAVKCPDGRAKDLRPVTP